MTKVAGETSGYTICSVMPPCRLLGYKAWSVVYSHRLAIVGCRLRRCGVRHRQGYAKGVDVDTWGASRPRPRSKMAHPQWCSRAFAPVLHVFKSPRTLVVIWRSLTRKIYRSESPPQIWLALKNHNHRKGLLKAL